MKPRLICALALAAVALAAAVGAQAPTRKKLLFLTHAGLYKHSSLGPAERAVSEIGAAGGFDVVTVEGYKQDAAQLDLKFLTPDYLAGFDGLMLMTNGNLPLAVGQKQALLDFVASGKGFVGAHCAALTLYDYTPFGEMLGGYYRRSIRQNAIAVLKVEDQTHPATRMLGGSWPVVDEFYLFGTAPWDASRPKDNIDVLFGNRIPMGFSRERVHVLLSLDTEKSDISRFPDVSRGGDYPQAWWREYGKGRSIYTSLGHRDEIWSHDPVFRAHIRGAIRWALRLED